MAILRRTMRTSAVLGLTVTLAACGGGGLFSGGNDPAPGGAQQRADTEVVADGRQGRPAPGMDAADAAFTGGPRAGTTIWDLFGPQADPNVTGAVNRYIWNASLEVLDFLPVQTVDPFTGVMVTGYGTPPGGGREVRATVLVNDTALDARSLSLALNTRAGPADAQTVRAVEDAILTRARQLRVRDRGL